MEQLKININCTLANIFSDILRNWYAYGCDEWRSVMGGLKVSMSRYDMCDYFKNRIYECSKIEDTYTKLIFLLNISKELKFVYNWDSYLEQIHEYKYKYEQLLIEKENQTQKQIDLHEKEIFVLKQKIDGIAEVADMNSKIRELNLGSE